MPHQPAPTDTPAHHALARLVGEEGDWTTTGYEETQADLTTVREALFTGMEAAEMSGIIANFRSRYGDDPSLRELYDKVNKIAWPDREED